MTSVRDNQPPQPRLHSVTGEMDEHKGAEGGGGGTPLPAPTGRIDPLPICHVKHFLLVYIEHRRNWVRGAKRRRSRRTSN